MIVLNTFWGKGKDVYNSHNSRLKTDTTDTLAFRMDEQDILPARQTAVQIVLGSASLKQKLHCSGGGNTAYVFHPWCSYVSLIEIWM
jgi:hypothetical protein